MRTPCKNVRRWTRPKEASGNDPVVKHGTWWYWYDETWTAMFGPYVEESHARAALDKYVKEELNGEGSAV